MPEKPGTDWIPSLHPSNPYNFPPEMIHAGRLPPKHADTHIFFFGYEKDGHDDPTVGLQQWYPSPFKSDKDGIEFITTEHYMMYHKALVMGDIETAGKILAAPHPSEAKALGRQVKNFDRQKWDENADRIVEEGNWLKFTQHEDLKELLEATYVLSLIMWWIRDMLMTKPVPMTGVLDSIAKTQWIIRANG